MTQRETLNALIIKAEAHRAYRAEHCPMLRVKWTGTRWEGECQGVSGIYHPRITLVGYRSFNCSCPDKKARGREVGPCKHVISLARKALEHLWVLEVVEKGAQ